MVPDDMLKRVAIIGPECTGKSDLSQFLAAHYNTKWVPEYARTYLDKINRPYEINDLLTIAKGQLHSEEDAAALANKILICDTNLYVIKVWSEYKYGRTDPFILNNIATRQYDLYLLTYIDIPWEEDPLREHPQQRDELFEIYLKEMKQQPVPFSIIRGSREERQSQALNAIQKLLI